MNGYYADFAHTMEVEPGVIEEVTVYVMCEDVNDKEIIEPILYFMDKHSREEIMVQYNAEEFGKLEQLMHTELLKDKHYAIQKNYMNH